MDDYVKSMLIRWNLPDLIPRFRGKCHEERIFNIDNKNLLIKYFMHIYVMGSICRKCFMYL